MTRSRRIGAAPWWCRLFTVFVLGCGELPDVDPPVSSALTEIPEVPGYSQLVQETAPADNQLNESRAQLGKQLFFDKRLSSDGTIACASCHQQVHGFADPRRVSLGVEGRVGKRNASHLVNLAWVRTGLFWDGRVSTLEEQVTHPISDPLEMDLPLLEAIARLEAEPDYIDRFKEAYGGMPSVELLQKALASFVRTIVSANSPYDRHLAGDGEALTESAERGLGLFLDKAECFHCHSAQTLTNDGFFNNGTFLEGGDVGRQAITGRTGDTGKFRVPSLRNVGVTAPYMHDGSIATLMDVIEHYARGGRGHAFTDPQIEPLPLTERDKSDLLAFLESLTDHDFLLDPRFGITGSD